MDASPAHTAPVVAGRRELRGAREAGASDAHRGPARAVIALNEIEVALIDEARPAGGEIERFGPSVRIDVVVAADQGEPRGDRGLLIEESYTDGLMRLSLIWRPGPANFDAAFTEWDSALCGIDEQRSAPA